MNYPALRKAGFFFDLTPCPSPKERGDVPGRIGTRIIMMIMIRVDFCCLIAYGNWD